MYSRFVSRFAVAALLSLSIATGLNAHADTPVVTAPDLEFNLPADVTIHKTMPCQEVQVQATDAAGLRSITISGGYAGGTSYFPAGTKSATTGVGFYACYFPTGNYAFRATAVNAAGKYTTKQIMVHLVP